MEVEEHEDCLTLLRLLVKYCLPALALPCLDPSRVCVFALSRPTLSRLVLCRLVVPSSPLVCFVSFWYPSYTLKLLHPNQKECSYEYYTAFERTNNQEQQQYGYAQQWSDKK